jgi:hypothetical protein
MLLTVIDIAKTANLHNVDEVGVADRSHRRRKLSDRSLIYASLVGRTRGMRCKRGKHHRK